MAKGKQLKVTLVRSTAHKLQAHKDTVRGLGLRRQRHSVVLDDTPAIRGMVNAVNHLVRVEEI